MIYFFRRERETRSCETRLEIDGHGYELVITDGPETRVERFEDVDELVAREYELRQAWWAHGWRALDDDDVDE